MNHTAIVWWAEESGMKFVMRGEDERISERIELVVRCLVVVVWILMVPGVTLMAGAGACKLITVPAEYYLT